MNYVTSISGGRLAELQDQFDALHIAYYKFCDMMQERTLNWPATERAQRMKGFGGQQQTDFQYFKDRVAPAMTQIQIAVERGDKPRFKPFVRPEIDKAADTARREFSALAEAIAAHAAPEESASMQAQLAELAQRMTAVLEQVSERLDRATAIGGRQV